MGYSASSSVNSIVARDASYRLPSSFTTVCITPSTVVDAQIFELI